MKASPLKTKALLSSLITSLFFYLILIFPHSAKSQQMDENCGMTVATCYAQFGAGDVGVIYDTRFNAAAPAGNDWVTVPDVHPAQWKRNIIGNVFGIALDDGGEIYLAASDIYNYDATNYGIPPGLLFPRWDQGALPEFTRQIKIILM